MDPLSWIAFGLVNILTLSAFDQKQKKRATLPSLLLGISGALSGGFAAYALFTTSQTRLSGMLLIVLTIEITILLLLYISRELRMNTQ